MEKAALINSQNIVVNVIVWDDTCVEPEGTTAIMLDNSSTVSIGWIWKGGETFEDPNPLPEPLPEVQPEPTVEEKLQQVGLTVEELKELLGL